MYMSMAFQNAFQNIDDEFVDNWIDTLKLREDDSGYDGSSRGDVFHYLLDGQLFATCHYSGDGDDDIDWSISEIAKEMYWPILLEWIKNNKDNILSRIS